MIACKISQNSSFLFNPLMLSIFKGKNLKLGTRFVSSQIHEATTGHERKSTIVALNIGDSISIDRLKGINELSDYKISNLPPDLQKEAILLSPGQVTKHDELGDIFVFRKGTIVLWGVSNEIQRKILRNLNPLTLNPHSNDLIQEERDYLKFTINKSSDRSKLHRDVVQLANCADKSMRQIDQFAISHAIASSVKLAVWEFNLDEYINSTNWIINRMKNGEDLKLTRGQVFKKTGEIYQLKHKIISSDLLDLPDVYWDRYNQEVLYLSLVSFLNIKKRTAVMNEKLNNCCELMNLLATHMSDKHHIRLEWMIISLILIEVIFEIIK